MANQRKALADATELTAFSHYAKLDQAKEEGWTST